jgi:geranylgeranyl diphosphate synthase type I
MKFSSLMDFYRKGIDGALAQFFNHRIARVKSLPGVSKEAFSILQGFTLRPSKRIRPMLAIVSYKGFGGKKESEIIKASLSVELMHSFLLVHDDIIDKDDVRRGKPTVHKEYEAKKRDSHYGASMALVVGDIAAMLGGEAIMGTRFPADRKLLALRTYNRTVINTCFGQLLDIEAEHGTTTEGDVRAIHSLKTAVYTVEGPMHIGALLAGASHRDLEGISAVALPLGKAFQIRDDILGLYGDEKRIGKPVGADVREGKQTLLVVRAMEAAGEHDRRFISKCLGNERLTSQQLERFRGIVVKTGSLSYCERLMRELVRESLEKLKDLKMRKEAKDFLAGLADYLISRKK